MHDFATERLTAVGVGAVRAKPRTFDSGRTCVEEGCDTRLSRYNPRALCWQHDPGRRFVPTAPRRRAREKRGPVVVDLP